MVGAMSASELSEVTSDCQIMVETHVPFIQNES